MIDQGKYLMRVLSLKYSLRNQFTPYVVFQTKGSKLGGLLMFQCVEGAEKGSGSQTDNLRLLEY